MANPESLLNEKNRIGLRFGDEENPVEQCSCQNRLSHIFFENKVNLMVENVRPCLSWKEVKTQCYLAGPLIVGNLLSFCLQMVSISFVGRFGELELSGASIANSFSVVTGFSVVLGLGYTLETLCGQAFGARQYQKLGIYTQRAIIVLNVTSIPLAFIWANIERILLLLGQDAQIASKAGEYGVLLIPTLFAAATSQPFVKFLQAQSLVAPLLLISLATLLCHVPVCAFMVFKSGLGYRGAALANSISYWIDALFLVLYVRFSNSCSQSWVPLSLEAFQDMKAFLKLAVPSAAMICLEWWSYDVLVILSGLLPNPELETATISICVNTVSLIFMLPMGLSAAASTRIANALGAAVLLLVRNFWGLVYSNEDEVVDMVAELAPFLALSTTFDSLQQVLSGVARGAGWQQIGAYINLGSFYIVGLPVGCLLAFVGHLNGKGLLIGLVVGVTVQFASFVVITHLTDWDIEAMNTVARVNSTPSAVEPLLVT
ncbi:hypothetical protein KP509_11G048600 [Ceratopteris richardii]|uniref:Protein DETOXIFICATION n=1 Tax=Ceratopteris richardii TaxID=49495 RepID=A0A8T2TSA1_CERRI|nr:hypothetical protein KP509_11G048600 [Ceratopteris richardii]